MSRLVGRKGRLWDAAIEPLARGGEGEVFPVVFDESHLVKVYHVPPGERQVRKLNALVDLLERARGNPDPSARAMQELFGLSAWPIDVVTHEGGDAVAGYVMRRLEGHRQLSHLTNRMRRDTHFPGVGWDFVVHTAANLARCVATVHAAGVVIGDLNDRNFGVDGAGIVRLWDADSVQLVHDGVTHLCPVGDPMHTPPELHGAELSSVVRTTDQDNFGLAVVVFSLLMQGQHPFAGVKPGMGTDLQEALDRAIFVYGEQGQALGWDPPVGSPWLSHLPPEIGEMFERAFRAHRTREPRPTATEWISALERMQGTLEACGRGHWAVGGLKCPWCHAVAETRHQVFEPERALFDEVALAEGRLGPLPASLLRTVEEVERALEGLSIAMPVLGDIPQHSAPVPSEWVRWEVARSMAPVHAAMRKRKRWLWFFRVPMAAVLLMLAVAAQSLFLVVVSLVVSIPPYGKKNSVAAKQAARYHFGHLQRRVSTWVGDVQKAHASLLASDHAAVFELERRKALESLRAGEAEIRERRERVLANHPGADEEARLEASVREARGLLVRQHAVIVARLTREAEEHVQRISGELDEHARRMSQVPQANADIAALGRALVELEM